MSRLPTRRVVVNYDPSATVLVDARPAAEIIHFEEHPDWRINPLGGSDGGTAWLVERRERPCGPHGRAVWVAAYGMLFETALDAMQVVHGLMEAERDG